MSNRIYGTEKVENIIGLPGKKDYSRIDLYVDIANPNNTWAIVQSIEYKKRKQVTKEEIIRFPSRDAMLDYLKNNFDCYELFYPVDMSQKKIFHHFVDYCDMSYYMHDGKPNLNYVTLNFIEHENNMFINRNVVLPKEYESLFQDILKASKGINPTAKIGSKFEKEINVYDERAKAFRKRVDKYTVPLGEHLYKAGEKVINIKNHIDKKKIVKALKIVCATATLGAVLAGGYVLVRNHTINSEFVKQTNPVANVEDLRLYVDKGSKGITINKLMDMKYDEISLDELKSVLTFIRELENSNYDYNNSFNSFNYSDYFDLKLLENNNSVESCELLGKIEDLYNKSFLVEDDRVNLIETRAKKYIEYLSSLTFMYDTYHMTRPFSQVKTDYQSITSEYATQNDMKLFDSYPPILKYILLSQLKGMLSHTNYNARGDTPYYFGGKSQYDLLEGVSKEIDSVISDLYSKCGFNYKRM